MFRRTPLQQYSRLPSRLLTSNRPVHAPLMSSQSNPSPHPHPHPEKALPAPNQDGANENAQDAVTTLDLSGGDATVTLDALGPMVVNQDGTISRISNWATLSDLERTNTLRIIGKRNQKRLAALRRAQESPTSSENGGRDDKDGSK